MCGHGGLLTLLGGVGVPCSPQLNDEEGGPAQAVQQHNHQGHAQGLGHGLRYAGRQLAVPAGRRTLLHVAVLGIVAVTICRTVVGVQAAAVGGGAEGGGLRNLGKGRGVEALGVVRGQRKGFNLAGEHGTGSLGCRAVRVGHRREIFPSREVGLGVIHALVMHVFFCGRGRRMGGNNRRGIMIQRRRMPPLLLSTPPFLPVLLGGLEVEQDQGPLALHSDHPL